MQSSNPNRNGRLQNRVPAVFPVRVRGTDVEGQPFEEIAHTLDITATGARVAAIHHQLRIADRVTVIYRQRRTAFSVVWAKAIDKHEFQVGLQTVNQENESWGLKPSDFEVHIPCTPVRWRKSLEAARQWSRGGVMNRDLNKLWRDSEGQDVAEYAVMMAIVLVLVTGVVRLIGINASAVFSEVGSKIQ